MSLIDTSQANIPVIDVLLCGSRYAATYLPAIYQSRQLRLAGLFARGSDASVRLAEQAGVPLYTEAGQLGPLTVDLACIALPQSVAVTLAQQLLRQGVPVLIEHPVSGANIRSLLAAAESGGTRCHINTHFAQLPPVREFIGLCRQLTGQSKPLVIQASCNSRTLFSLLDILQSAFGATALTQLQVTASPNTGYTLANFLLGDTLVNLTYQTWRGEQDNSLDAPLGHHLVVTYPEGALCLGGSFGPTYWAPLIAAGAGPQTPAYSSVYGDGWRTPRVADIVLWRTQANRQALLDLSGDYPAQSDIAQRLAERRQSPAQLQHLCDLWSQLQPALGSHTPTLRAPVLSPAMWRAETLAQNPS